MTTKAEERAALKKIEKIIAGLGEESYIGKAFEGCIDMAETNIENDFWESWKERAGFYQDELKDRDATVARLSKEVEAGKEIIKGRNERIELLEKECVARTKDVLEETKEVFIRTTDGEAKRQRFSEIKYINHNGFKFVNVIENSGWTTSYKLDDIVELTIG